MRDCFANEELEDSALVSRFDPFSTDSGLKKKRFT
jgi:hypothetical protein